MQLRKWISAQMKADDEVEATGITGNLQAEAGCPAWNGLQAGPDAGAVERARGDSGGANS